MDSSSCLCPAACSVLSWLKRRTITFLCCQGRRRKRRQHSTSASMVCGWVTDSMQLAAHVPLCVHSYMCHSCVMPHSLGILWCGCTYIRTYLHVSVSSYHPPPPTFPIPTLTHLLLSSLSPHSLICSFLPFCYLDYSPLLPLPSSRPFAPSVRSAGSQQYAGGSGPKDPGVLDRG